MNKSSIIYQTLFLLKKPVLGLCSKVIGSSEYLLITLSCSDRTMMNMQSRCIIITLWKEFSWGFITRQLFCNTLRELTLLTVLHFFTSLLFINLFIMAYSPITLKTLLPLGLPVAFIESSRNFLILTFLILSFQQHWMLLTILFLATLPFPFCFYDMTLARFSSPSLLLLFPLRVILLLPFIGETHQALVVSKSFLI